MLDSGDKDKIERIRLINEHFYNGELPCYQCGAVNNFQELVIDPQVFKNGKIHYRAECAHCGKYIKYLSQKAIPRIWNFEANDLIEVSKASSNLLSYHLQNGKLDEPTKEAILLKYDDTIKKTQLELDNTRQQTDLFENTANSNEHWIDKALKSQKVTYIRGDERIYSKKG